MNIAIIGLRGVGKSNVSRRLALRLKRPVLSTDVLIEYETGLPVPQVVAEHGWREFRELEHRVIERLARLDCIIVDCGGGVVVDLDDAGNEAYSERNIELLRSSGVVVWLKGDPERLAAKSVGDARRPELDERHSPLDLMQRRQPFYDRAADLTIDVESRSRPEIAKRIERWVVHHPRPGWQAKDRAAGCR